MLIFGANVCLTRYITVYYDAIGLSRAFMGVLLMLMPLTTFIGGLFWSTVVDRTGGYKETLVGTSLVGIGVIFCYLLPQVQVSQKLLIAITCLHGFLCSVSSPIVDALTLKVLSEHEGSDEGYGDQRLWSAVGWGAMAFVAGWIVDLFGISAVFFLYGSLVTMNIIMLGKYMPSMSKTEAAAIDGQGTKDSASILSVLNNFEAVWLLSNLMVYGIFMALVENFLNVYLIQDFVAVPGILLGMATMVTCAFEVPIFKYIDSVWKGESGSGRLVAVLTVTELLLAVRCFAYTMLPRDRPWLVLLVEPLHGFTFAAMWCATVEYARRLAPPGKEARMQALTNGLFFNVAFATGSFFWRRLVQRPPAGLGFSATFRLNTALILVWLLIWQLGWRFQKRQAVKASAP
eukprot:TRINITY_DN29047_c0_g1_i2.p1 TRINITY_DN29047_c0_g1~~TRINITY_DN29047_c0_g1_i2.p1  ORF type:complete len:402 (+),score=72.72 TRINITY_DN29047_c0_g1_i2:342-1547(+)